MQPNLFPVPEQNSLSPSGARENARSGSFTDNMRLPVHRWFRYSAGFSAAWTESVIDKLGGGLVCDPFAGSGTTLLAAQARQTPSLGLETHPFVYRVARAKLSRAVDTAALRRVAGRVLATATRRSKEMAPAAAYFLDLARVFLALRKPCKPGAKLCFVVGDSSPYGIYLAVDEWLGRLVLAAGFRAFSFEKLRDRNVKWKNRKHSVPLHEDRLWIEG